MGGGTRGERGGARGRRGQGRRQRKGKTFEQLILLRREKKRKRSRKSSDSGAEDGEDDADVVWARTVVVSEV